MADEAFGRWRSCALGVLIGLLACGGGRAHPHQPSRVRQLPPPSAPAASPKLVVAAACTDQLRVLEFAATGPALDQARHHVSPDRTCQLDLETVAGKRARGAAAKESAASQWKVTLTAARHNAETWLLGSSVVADAAPSVAWGHDCRVALLWTDRVWREANEPGCCADHLDQLRLALLTPGQKPVDRVLGGPSEFLAATLLEVQGQWWLIDMPSYVRRWIVSPQAKLEWPIKLADRIGSRALFQLVGDRIAMASLETKHWPAGSDNSLADWSNESGVRLVVFGLDGKPLEDHQVLAPSPMRGGWVSPTALAPTPSGFWVITTVSPPQAPDELQFVHVSSGSDGLARLRTRFDYGWSAVRIVSANAEELHGEIDENGQTYHFKLGVGTSCSGPPPAVECRGRVRSRTLVSARPVLSFGAVGVELRSVELPAEDTLLIAFDKRTRAELGRVSSRALGLGPVEAACIGPAGAGLGLGLVASDRFVLVAIDERGQAHAERSIAGGFSACAFTALATGRVFALTRRIPDANALEDVDIFDDQGRRMRTYERLQGQHPLMAWSGKEGAAFVRGSAIAPFQVLAIDGRGVPAERFEPLRMQFERDAQPLIADPTRGVLPYAVWTDDRSECD